MNPRDEDPAGEPAPDPESVRSPYGGLCALCRHARSIESDRGSVFVLCGRSREDRRFSRYPPQPVVSCPGFER